MSSKSPVRSCDDVDETALSYSEIKALCAGNPLIAEKMALDNDVARLRMLKSEHKSEHYRLEDSLLKHYPQQLASVTERIAGIEKDIAHYSAEHEKCVEIKVVNGAASVSSKFPGMTVNGVAYAEKELAAKALLEMCKDVKGRNTDIPVGYYMGFSLSMRYESYGQQINLLVRGAMTYRIDLGTDALGNITRINNALEKLPERLQGQRDSLANIEKQIAAAKEELAKPFPQEEELQAKESRLALLNADLNIDGVGDMDVLNDTEDRSEQTETGDGADEPDREPDESDEADEPEEPADMRVLPERENPKNHAETAAIYGYSQPQAGTGTYGKSRPGILADIEEINRTLKQPARGGGKSAEVIL